MPVADDAARKVDAPADDWEKGEMTRRKWVKLTLAAGAVGGAAAVTAAFGGTLLSPAPSLPSPLDALGYTKFPEPEWWSELEGQLVKVGDFGLWQGASAIWRGTFSEGQLVSGTGYSVLVIRIPRDATGFQSPPATSVPLPHGYSLYYDDAARNIRIVVLYDRCAHLCCFPGWQVVKSPPPLRNYVAACPTYEVYGLDPVYCVCHGSQYDPLVLTTDVNPGSGVTYVGAERVLGPAGRSVPVVAVRADQDVLYGGMLDPRWYEYC